MNKRLYFDIETGTCAEACALMPEPKPAANLKDPAKIAADIADKKAALLDNAPLDPDYGKVLSIWMAIGLEGEIEVLVNQDLYPKPPEPEEWLLPIYAMPEHILLDFFWRNLAVCEGNCVGFNVLGFDLPFLLRRSMALNVQVYCQPNLARYRTEPTTDLMQILYNFGAEKYKGLKQIARLYGLVNECPDVDGSQVKDLNPEKLRAYQTSDVKLVQQLYRKMNGVYFYHGELA